MILASQTPEGGECCGKPEPAITRGKTRVTKTDPHINGIRGAAVFIRGVKRVGWSKVKGWEAIDKKKDKGNLGIQTTGCTRQVVECMEVSAHGRLDTNPL